MKSIKVKPRPVRKTRKSSREDVKEGPANGRERDLGGNNKDDEDSDYDVGGLDDAIKKAFKEAIQISDTKDRQVKWLHSNPAVSCSNMFLLVMTYLKARERVVQPAKAHHESVKLSPDQLCVRLVRSHRFVVHDRIFIVSTLLRHTLIGPKRKSASILGNIK